ncbi:squamous cell carcinoma antigen recognized by T-cells 3 [Scyliorhinus canicula]|uniref:squamous cell carcinoma antigen recognized by T-cells 3 n=1 Tax=Scyliorhinus canicula TaxID=7830 RepID=UPI0018F517EE|nr:squamous cell carcinoma antigen recognized by T-cells 3 [Scyliorhinus canicula]
MFSFESGLAAFPALVRMMATGGRRRSSESEELEQGSSGESEEEMEDSSEDDQENEAEIQRLEEQLSISVYDYNCHVDLIKLLRQEGELEKLRSARQKMSELFPLTEELWLDWLKDEIRMAGKASDRENVYELFEKAIKDYICPEIWLEYAQYSIGGIGQQGGIEKARGIFDRALTAVGLHMTKGVAIWEAFREFENAILGTLQPSVGSILTPEQQEMVNAQLERIHTLFKRQLGVPLLDMETTYAEYEEWADEPNKSVTEVYKKAQQQMEKRKPYEENLLVADPPKLAEYQAYIDFEVKDGDPARIQIIFERALSENCLVPELWARFTLYLDRQLKIKDLVVSAHERAVRNCPWIVGLWKRYLLALERHQVEHKIIIETFEKALNAGFIQATDYVELWQAFLDYLRRRVNFSQDSSQELEELRSAFSRGVDYLKQDIEQRFGESGDPSCTILQNWARIEARLCKNIQKARELWDRIMTKGNATYANMWLEYYNLERAHGDPQHCRKALHRAVQCTTDYPEHVCDVLLAFERLEGSLEDWDLAVEKTETRLNRVNQQRTKAAEKEALLTKQEEEKNVQRKKGRSAKKAAKKAQKQALPGDKRKADQEEWGVEIDQPNKKPRAGELEEAEEEDMSAECGLFGRENNTKILETPALQKQKAVAATRNKVLHDNSKDDLTVFVSNLSYSMPNPEERLKEVFESIGQIAEIRPIYSNRGLFRGYCYVEFQEEKAAADALRLDRQELEGRPMFVSPCVDKAKNPDFKVFRYSTSLEKHKVFISGLPFSCTKEALEEICKEHGTLKEIRLVTNRSGKPKGLAYAEYENEAQASQAVLKMDGMVVKDHPISVAISNPPQRKQTSKVEASRSSGSLLSRQVYGARGKGRTQLALVPRALQRLPASEANTENGTLRDQDGNSKGDSSIIKETKKMTNADFAKMLLKK